ncbi:mitochondrial carrier [Hanseniaspora valbyensis NRRL Y-1626]|uniref:Mitochondrial glycine transporter n=1 Tax=Hanseniaspora valbyensis NRRL Y-1626 TaxID=766949 RepID=A0A1B7TDR8_9ASCO|nr:mitochondrial carrier [Hanseniaspora valbyensis NRRL Y-1626]
MASENSESVKTVSNKKHLYSAFLVGGISSVALQPLDLLKTRKQQQNNNGAGKFIFKLGAENYKIIDLWKGTLPSFLRTSIGSALYLTTLNKLRQTISTIENKQYNKSTTYNKSSNLPKISNWGNLISGSIARSAIGFLLMPLTVIKTRFESTIYNYKSLNEAVKDIYKENKINGFFKGFGSTILRDSPYAGIYLVNYEFCKNFLNKHTSVEQNNFLVNSSSAVIAACTSSAITAPFDTIRVRIQLQPNLNKNLFTTFVDIAKNEGFIKLFDGLTLRLMRKSLAAAIAWGVYEELIK